MKTKKYTARSEENFEQLSKLMTKNPSTSQRTTARRIDVLQMTIQRMLSDLNLRSYKIQFTQPLNEDHKQKILVFAQNMKQLMNDDGINVKQFFIPDGAYFYLHRDINKQNYRFWAHENPHITESKERKRQKVTVRCAPSATQIFEPVFIEENITGDVYNTLLNFFGVTKIIFWRIFGLCKTHGLCKTCTHRTKPVFSLLTKTFHDRDFGLGYPTKYGCGFDWSMWLFLVGISERSSI